MGGDRVPSSAAVGNSRATETIVYLIHHSVARYNLKPTFAMVGSPDANTETTQRDDQAEPKENHRSHRPAFLHIFGRFGHSWRGVGKLSTMRRGRGRICVPIRVVTRWGMWGGHRGREHEWCGLGTPLAQSSTVYSLYPKGVHDTPWETSPHICDGIKAPHMWIVVPVRGKREGDRLHLWVCRHSLEVVKGDTSTIIGARW